MKLVFDDFVLREEQLIRASRRKKVGRKHMHTLGPSDVAARKKRREKHIAQKIRRFKNKVRAYWLGARDTYPTPF